MIRRETDTALLDRISNLPEVRSFICYHDRPLDWRPALQGCVVLSNGKDGIAVFEEGMKGVYQGHVFFAPTCRGRKALKDGREMIEHMFASGAELIWGAMPLKNRAVRWFAHQLGAEKVGEDIFQAEGPVELIVIRKGS